MATKAAIKTVDGHSELLEDALGTLILHGAHVVDAYRLMRWTNTQRVTYKMWLYIHQLFDLILKSEGEHTHGYKLYVGEGNDTYTFLIWDRGEGSEMAESPWWNSIEALEQPKKRVKAARADEESSEVDEENSEAA